MKKIVTTILLLIYISISLSATTPTLDDNTHPFTIQAGYQDVIEINFVTIAAQEENFAVGMPFNVEDPTVKPRTMEGLGRQIASWNFISNKDFSMSAILEPLTHVHSKELGTDTCDCKTKPNYALWYTLGLNFSLSYYTNADLDKSMEGTFIISPTEISDSGTSSETDPVGDSPVNAFMGLYIPPNTYKSSSEDPTKQSISIGDAIPNITDTLKHGFIGSAQGFVIFSFTEQTVKEKIAAAYPGRYEGSVTVKITAKD